MARDQENMDQFAAHMDRAWDLVSLGDTRGARSSARQAQEIDPENPELYNLLGHISAADGDADEALEHYRQAMALDDEYLEPILNAAEVLVHPLGEYDEAIALCEEALEISLGVEEQVDALLLKFDALLGKGDREVAARVLEDLPEGPYEGGNYEFQIGGAFHSVGNDGKAEEHLRRALEIDPEHAEAHYTLGIIADDRGELERAIEHYVIVRELDRRAARVPWSPAAAEFRTAVEEGLTRLSEAMRSRLHRVRVYYTDAPGIELVADGCDPRIPLLLDGFDGGTPTRLFVYQRNVERLYYSGDRMKEDLPSLLVREIEAALHDRTPPPSPRS